jgi:hypothetical protein
VYYNPPPNGVETPHFVNSEDCQGNPESYWRTWAWHDGKIAGCGMGLTPEEAIRVATSKLEAYKENVGKSPKEQLQKLLDSTDRLLYDDLEKVVRLLAGIVLK